MQKSKKTALSAVFPAVIFVFAALCAPARAGEERMLYLYTWSDYFDSEVIYEFEQEYGCHVAIDYFDSNESMYAKLKAGGGGYDLITPSSYMSAVMRKQDMLLPLDHAAIPNLGNMDRNFLKFTEDPEMAHSVPYTRTVTGVGYNTTRVDATDLGSWSIFASDDYATRMTMLNDMREAIGAALKFLGFSLNTTDEKELAAAGDVLAEWKRRLAKFDVDEAKIGLASGEFFAIQGYNGDVALVMEENPDIDFYIPREGSSLASDDFVISADTPNAELAHAFINHMLNPEVAARNMESVRYYMPNPAAAEMLSGELRNNRAFNVDDSVLESCEVIRDLGPDNEKYIAVWDRVKAEE